MNTLSMAMDPESSLRDTLIKVPAITLSFWIIKILSTTVGETAADYLAVDAGWGQSATRLVMAALLAAALITQVRMRRYTPWAYWLSVVLVSIVGTQITDLLTDGLGPGALVSGSALYRLALSMLIAHSSDGLIHKVD
ncbi:hypothetical protein CDEF62S_02408 [Castellaniella defragrans]